LVHCLEGKIDIKVGENNFIVSKGDLLKLPAAIPHALSANQKAKMILTMIKSSF
jgi:quercetin dioxygenase-like cupin family protein